MRPRSDGERLRTSAVLRALFHSRAFSRGREFHLEKIKKGKQAKRIRASAPIMRFKLIPATSPLPF